MKRTVLGVLMMIIGTTMFVTATTLFAVSAQENDIAESTSAAIVERVHDNTVYTGEYYLDGDTSKECITVSDSTLTFTDGSVKDYTLSVWKDMPVTDEQSGKITYVDYCFLKIGKDKISYDPADKEIEIGSLTYRLK